MVLAEWAKERHLEARDTEARKVRLSPRLRMLSRAGFPPAQLGLQSTAVVQAVVGNASILHYHGMLVRVYTRTATYSVRTRGVLIFLDEYV